MPAYSDMYLTDAMENLGEMADFAVRTLGADLDDFWKSFIATEYASEFAHGSPRVVAGMSGSEIAVCVGERAGLSVPEHAYIPAAAVAREAARGKGMPIGFGLTCEYWCGWALAFYQWRSAKTFKDIHRALSMADIQRMYPTFHEESEERFAEAADEMVVRGGKRSRLQTQRTIAGLSQAQLAHRSGVGIRAIQQYEQGAKDINKASVDKILAMAQVLHCCPEDLLEAPSRYEYAVVGL